jgi:cobalt-zinc-cadmium efflux system membrane fusion protein
MKPGMRRFLLLASLLVLVLLGGAVVVAAIRPDVATWAVRKIGGDQADHAERTGDGATPLAHGVGDGHAHGPGDGHAHGLDDAHDHPGHSEANAVSLSRNGLKNIGFQGTTIRLGTYTRSVTMPAMVVERPGRSQIQITAPLTGVVTRIYPIEGAALTPDSPMFDLRLTHEELVAAQRDVLKTVERLDVVNREIERLKAFDAGVVAGKRVLEQEYERQLLEASLRAERQALRLHGLSEEHVEAVVRDRKLFQTLTVRAPAHDDDDENCREDHLYHVQQIPVTLGQQVTAGELLCVIADHCELYIEGRAFEDDAARLRQATREGWDVTATLPTGNDSPETVQHLKLLYLADHIDSQTRAFRFYLALPNEIVLDQRGPGGHRFLDWRFKPGQRMELRVPVERWSERIVLPVEAVVEEGAEAYVYQRNVDHFDRVPVHIEHRDQTSVVIANDGSLRPGDVVAARGAYQMHLALKGKSGGGVDPHAGHNH